MQEKKTWFLKNSKILKGISTDQWALLEESSELSAWRRNAVLWDPDVGREKMFWIRNGIVKVSQLTRSAGPVTVRFSGKDEMVGEISLFPEVPRTTRGLVFTDSVILSVPRDVVTQLISENALVAQRLTALIARRRYRYEQWVSTMLSMTVHSRLAALFLLLSEQFGVRDSRGIILDIKLTHKELASIVGMTRETVSFAILDMRKSGFILSDAKRVVIIDQPGLKAVAERE
jgi:CRP/FNR family transcriptional regulator, cyclic AMP receptor protein